MARKKTDTADRRLKTGFDPVAARATLPERTAAVSDALQRFVAGAALLNEKALLPQSQLRWVADAPRPEGQAEGMVRLYLGDAGPVRFYFEAKQNHGFQAPAYQLTRARANGMPSDQDEDLLAGPTSRLADIAPALACACQAAGALKQEAKPFYSKPLRR